MTAQAGPLLEAQALAKAFSGTGRAHLRRAAGGSRG